MLPAAGIAYAANVGNYSQYLDPVLAIQASNADEYYMTGTRL